VSGVEEVGGGRGPIMILLSEVALEAGAGLSVGVGEELAGRMAVGEEPGIAWVDTAESEAMERFPSTPNLRRSRRKFFSRWESWCKK
jgi:hypothetical protein